MTITDLPCAVVRGRKNPLHMAFSQRLRQARRNRETTLEQVAQAAGLAGPSVVRYLESAQRTPHIDTVERLARALGLSAGVLAYGMDGEEPHDNIGASGVGARLRASRQERGLSARALAQQSATSHTAIGNIERGDTMPNLATVESLALALGLSPAWLGFAIGARECSPPRRVSSTGSPSARA